MRASLFGRAASLAAGAVVLVSACGLGSSTSSSTSSSQPIVVGISEPLSGDKSDIGTASDQGYQVWATVVNNSGGLIGRKIKIIQYDNNSLADTAVSQYQRLVTVDKADVLLGPVSSALVIPASVVAARYNKVFVEGTGGAPAVFSRHFNNLFFVQPAPIEDSADPLVNWIKSLPASDRPAHAAYPSADDPFATAVIDKVQTLAEPVPVPTVYKQVYPPTQTDFTALGAQLKSAGVDMLVQGSVADQDGIGAVKSYSQVGFQPKIAYFANGPGSTNTWKSGLENKVEGTMTSLDWLQESPVPGNATFVKAYLKKYPNKDNLVPSEAAEAYAAGEVLAAAIKATNSVDNAKIIKWLHSHEVQSIEGKFGWDADGRPTGSEFTLVQWQSNHLNIVWPPNLATSGAKPTYPKPSW